MQMGIAGGIGWAGATEPYLIDHFPNVHGAGRNALGLFGDPDLVLSPAQFGNGGGFIQIGNHSLFSSEAFMAYASSGPTSGDVGHSTTLGFESLFNDGGVVKYSKPQFIGFPGTNIVANGWCNGFIDLYDVPAAWRSDVFSSAPNAEAGRRIIRMGINGIQLFQNESGFIGGGYTNTGNGTVSVSWNAGAGSPEGAKTAAIGSIYSRSDGGAATTLYVKESGTGNTGWVAVGGGGSSLWVLNEDSGPGGIDVLNPLNNEPAIGSAAGDFNVLAGPGGNLALYYDGGTEAVTFSGGVAGFATAIDMGAADFTWSGSVGGGVTGLQIDNDGVITRATGASQPNGVVFSSTPISVDLDGTGDTALLTVPAGKVFIMTSASVYYTDINNLTVPAQVKIKCNGGDITATTTLTGVTTGRATKIEPIALTAFAAQPADVIEIEVVVGATADSATARVMVTGYYIAE